MTENLSTSFFPDPKKFSQPKQKKGLKRKFPKASGEAEIFRQIWSERPHISEISEEPLGEEPHVFFFMHILSKKNYSRWRLEKFNIALGTFDEHYILDHGTIDDIENHPAKEGFLKLLAKREELKIKYQAKEPTT